MDERLIGFDLREQFDQVDKRWGSARRVQFLLRPGTSRPLSVDTLVWPSLFDTGQGIGLAPAERARLGLAGIPTPAWIGPNAGLWDTSAAMLETMHQAVAGGWRRATEWTSLGVTWLSDEGSGQGGPVGPYADPVDPPALGAWWRFLGFDVADGSLMSGLMNCGYDPEEAVLLAATWAPALNEHHLFHRIEDASAFRQLTDARVPEHAPFFVFGLYVETPLTPGDSGRRAAGGPSGTRAP